MATKLLTKVQLRSIWKSVGFFPNKPQEEAIFAGDGPVLVTAGPGSGKTRVLLHRVAYLITVNGVSPDKIFLSTFTEKAATQLEEGIRFLLGRISQESGVRFNPSNMFVGTTHALCGRLLGELRVDSKGKRLAALHPMDQFEQHRLVQKNWAKLATAAGLNPFEAAQLVTSQFGSGPSKSTHSAAKAATSFFNRMAEEMVSPEEGKAKAPKEDSKIFALYRAYRDLLAEESATDLSRLQLEAYNRLKDSNSSRVQFSHVIIDEYQDTNPVQEKTFMRLASTTGNLMVVGDDDQALYRFRGATVENLLRFETRCKSALKKKPFVVNLNINYRSRPEIVELYRNFMEQHDWRNPEKPSQPFRMAGKKLSANEPKCHVSVACTAKGKAVDVAEETAELVKRLLDSKKVSNPNEIAFLFPSVKGKTAGAMKKALEERGISVYAPRAGKFLDCEEARLAYGILVFFLRRGGKHDEHRHSAYQDWLNHIEANAKAAAKNDKGLARLLKEVTDEADAVVARDKAVLKACEAIGLTEEDVLTERSISLLAASKALGGKISARLNSKYLQALVRKRIEEGRPYRVSSLRKFLASLDWGLLDLFYRLLGVGHFSRVMSEAHLEVDEVGAFNLARISKQLAAFQEESSAVLGAEDLTAWGYRKFVTSYLYALWRSEEGEVEDEDQVFPSGSVPFLTIHQSKGLEFPVVVLGTTAKNAGRVANLERLARTCTGRDNEPEDRIPAFDLARQFYVALSRAKDLLVVARPKVQGQSTLQGLSNVLDGVPTLVSSLNVKEMKIRRKAKGPEYSVYSYTGDYLSYRLCPRQYMVFRRYGFAASRSQTMVFGSLVHRAIEEIHREIIDGRAKR